MSNMGNMGNMGNIAFGGGGGGGDGGGTFVLPTRSDLPFDQEEPRTGAVDSNGEWQWSPVTSPSPAPEDLSGLPAFPMTEWPQRLWAGRWYAWLILADFAATDWRTCLKIPRYPEPGDPLVGTETKNKFAQDIESLFRNCEDERADAIVEIAAQNERYEDCMAYFMALLGIDQRTHPKAHLLLHVAGLIGILTSMHFKQNPGNGQPPRPRPSHFYPALLPLTEVPPHPSYPSGHATQSMLMALILEEVIPTPQRGLAKPLLEGMAGRIARNREIGGLHYPSDSKAGFVLAERTKALLMTLPSFTAELALARAEWRQ